MSDYLEHHGIKGQKWGIRRFQNEDGSLTEEGKKRYGSVMSVKDLNKEIEKKGIRNEILRGAHVIPKGTIIYRTTSVENENDVGTTYVSYLNVDRQHYKGGWIRDTGTTGEAYEHTYTLNEDLVVPSRETAQKVVNEVMKENRDFVKDTVDKWINKIAYKEGSYSREYLEDTLTFDIAKKSDKRYWEVTPAEIKKAFNKFMADAVKGYENMTPDEAAFYVMQTFGVNHEVRDRVVKRLSSMGYNAMSDEASIGGHGNWAREGADPLIIFDRSGMLSETSNKKISLKEEKEALSSYYKGIRNARSKEKGVWSALDDLSVFLSHHGIKGQEWGVRRGPPYPIDRNGPIVVKKGTELNSTSVKKKIKLDSNRGMYLYDPNDSHDKAVYRGGFASSMSTWNRKLYTQRFTTSEDLILPSQKEKVETFKELCKNEDFKKVVDIMAAQFNSRSYKKMVAKWDELDKNEQTRLDRDWRMFSATPNWWSDKFRKQYIESLKSKGYNAMLDDFDANRYYGAHNPLIVFSQSSLESAGKAKRLWGDEITREHNKIARYGKGW